jgi:predicted solute-binding protein
MLGQAIWEKNYYKDLYYNLNRDEDEARDRFRELHDDCGSYL